MFKFFITIILFSIILFPVFLGSSFDQKTPLLFLPAFLGLFIFIIFQKLRNGLYLQYHGQFDSIDEKINLAKEKVESRKKILDSLPSKRRRISFLFKLSQDLIELNDAEHINDFLINSFADLFPAADTSLLLDYENETNSLRLSRSIKNHDLIIKSKHGDLLDTWSLRHNKSLLIDDLSKDFRFDYQTIDAYSERGVHSLLISPLSISHKVLGVARIESRSIKCFSLEDLRLLRNICDLGAVVLERANLFENAQNLATKDPLTSFYLKDFFFKKLKNDCQFFFEKKSKIGLIMIDIDDFKKINDNYGHIVGDAVLKKLSRIINAAAGGSGNYICRFGGEEFIAAVIGTEKKELLIIAEEIRKKAQAAVMQFRRKKVSFTVSLGVSIFPDQGTDVMKLVERADKLLYQAKKQGKNRLCFEDGK